LIGLPAEADGALAIGWATVELDRAAVELAQLLAPGTTFEEAPSSVILGARCRISSVAGTPGLRVVLLEPDTEGRLAAALARAGEGWRATWVADPGARPRPGQSSGARPGPLGTERLLLGAPLAGPYRLFVEAVPSPP
jgi:hypothetical protein